MNGFAFISGKAALAAFIGGIHIGADRGLDERDLNASGRLKASNRDEIHNEAEATVATLSALAYWESGGGSGSPPKTVADLEGLKEWVITRGLVRLGDEPTRIAASIQDRIYEEGSYHFRQGDPNEYIRAIEAAQPGINTVLNAFLRDIDAPMATQFAKAFAA